MLLTSEILSKIIASFFVSHLGKTLTADMLENSINVIIEVVEDKLIDETQKTDLKALGCNLVRELCVGDTKLTLDDEAKKLGVAVEHIMKAYEAGVHSALMLGKD